MKQRSPLTDLGRRIAAVQDARLARRPRPATKQRLLSGPAQRPAVRARWTIAIAAAICVVAALVLWVRSASSALDVTLSNGERAEVGRWLGASDAPLDLRFSDGTAVVLQPGSTARVASVDAKGARVVVERGFVDVAVAHVDGARWWFEVGPFTVRVTGTRFRAGWDPESNELTLELTEGSVAVSGPVVGAERAVSKGEALRVSVATATMELSNAPVPRGPTMAVSAVAAAPPPDAPTAAPAVPPTAPEAASRPQADAPPQPSASSAPTSVPAAEPSWTELSRAGKYKEALARAEAHGLDGILESASASELALLADVARLAGEGGKATKILATQRRRFKGDAQAATAAFMLGRAAFDEQKAYASAAKWFATYLEEQPTGPFAREALGRLAEARHLAGEKAGARSAARAYLAAYPDGPHAGVARSILAK